MIALIKYTYVLLFWSATELMTMQCGFYNTD